MAGLKIKRLVRLGAMVALTGSTVPYLFPPKISEEAKQALDQVDFYGKGNDAPHKVCLIESPEDALNARLAVIKNAQETLDIAYYSIREGPCADVFLNEVLLAANRGVQVRFLLDGKNGLTPSLKALGSHENVQLRLFNPICWYKPWLWQTSLHDKFIIADRRITLLGGRNIDERHFAAAGFEGPITHDRDVLVFDSWQTAARHPSAAQQVEDYFNALWCLKETRPFKKNVAAPIRAPADFRQSNPQFYQNTLADYRRQAVPAAKITLLHNPVRAGRKEPWIGYQIRRLALSSQERVWVQTPYATGKKLLLDAMTAAASKGELLFLTNSMLSSPNYPAYSNYFGQREKFIATGAQIYEYAKEDSIHGKSVLIDDRLSLVGSFNMDARSFFISTESMLVIDSHAFNLKLENAMNALCDEASPAQTAQVPHGGKMKKKMLRMRLFDFVLRPFQNLL